MQSYPQLTELPNLASMHKQLRYGAQATLSLDLPGDAVVAYCQAPRGMPLAEVGRALNEAFTGPLGYPPLARAVVPDDKVVLALGAEVPRAATLVAGTVAALEAAGVAPADITLLEPAGAPTSSPDPADELPPPARRAIRREIHEPGKRTALSFLGASRDSQAVYLNRTICDADLVISIGCLRLTESPGYFGLGQTLFPTYSDAASLARYDMPRHARGRDQNRLRAACDEIGWLLGSQFTVQVVPGSAGEILHVLAGETRAVATAGARLADEAWRYNVPARAALVVATIEGGPVEQTWANVGRALAAAGAGAEPDGAVVLCTELSEPPGEALQRLVGADSPAAALRAIEKSTSSDALAAAEAIDALERGAVYLVSRLDDELVEALGMSPIAPGQVSRLAARYPTWLILGNAHRALVRLRPEAETAAPPAYRKQRP